MLKQNILQNDPGLPRRFLLLFREDFLRGLHLALRALVPGCRVHEGMWIAGFITLGLVYSYLFVKRIAISKVEEEVEYLSHVAFGHEL